MPPHNEQLSRGDGDWRVRVFYATWLLYAAYYFCRKDTGKLPELLPSGPAPLATVSHILIVFGLAYSVAQVIAGWLSDRYGGQISVFSGALVSAGATVAVSFAMPLRTTLLLETVNGFGQGFGWSGSLKLLGQEFELPERPTVLAWWSGSYILGGYLATFLATYLMLNSSGGGEHLRVPDLFVSGCLLFCVALGAGWALRAVPRPSRDGGRFPIDRPILTIAAMYFLLKMIRYALLFWLPLYFTTNLAYSLRSAQNVASFFTLFGFAGSLLTVFLSDRIFQGQRFRTAAFLLFLLSFVLLLHPVLCHSGFLGATLSVGLMGMIIHGVDLLMSGIHVLDSVPPGQHGRAVGFVNAIGSLGQMLSAFVVSRVSSAYGWDFLFNLFVGFALLAALICCLGWRNTAIKPLIPVLT